MHELRSFLNFEHWSLFGAWDLGLGICEDDFR
jgi:hypothetical protein